MSLIRQMPALYLRGSLATVTMARLTKEQRKEVETVLGMVASHPAMQTHRGRIHKEFAKTIGADYKDNKAAADHEYLIAVWRSVVSLLYHHDYSFECRACGSNTFYTSRNKVKPIDRQQINCPNCKKTEITEPGCTGYTKGEFVDYEAFQAATVSIGDWQKVPHSKSPIEAVKQTKKYEDPQKILSDPQQIKRFFGEFVWNYFRQQIKENKRPEHGKNTAKILPQPVGLWAIAEAKKPKKPKDDKQRQGPNFIGPADEVYAQYILGMCRKSQVQCTYQAESQPEAGFYTIRLSGLQTTPDFTYELCLLRQAAAGFGVGIDLTANEIRVKATLFLPELEAYIQAYEHVSVLDDYTTGVGETTDGGRTVDLISYKSVGGQRMETDDHVNSVDLHDGWQAVRFRLPDGHCKNVFDLLSGQGELYHAFSEKHGTKTPRTNHLANFLGVTARVINQCRDTIEIQCRANSFLPSAV